MFVRKGGVQHPTLCFWEFFPDHTLKTKNAPKILTQIAEDLRDSRLYVIKATMCATGEKYKEEVQQKVRRCL